MNLALPAMFFLGYAIGMFPTAWLLRKLTSKQDLRTEGSGNIGARNLTEVSGNKWLGIVAFLIDALKGVAAIYIAQLIHGDWFAAKAWVGVGAVYGHNYNALLGFKGGRGLATATGIGFATTPIFVMTWGLMYLMGYFVIRRDVHVGAMTATIATAVLAYSIPEKVVRDTMVVVCYEGFQARLFIFALVFPIFLKHVAPIREVIARASTETDD